ncbi:PREDICTED: probable phospholipid-transporting ATPase IK [Chrysochloris asiatica]|uniref:Phospholipid-transporting ATPase n=1 Tax=Chrysochloris asiatica TaxID=185453 RepID=A0A9B0TYR6_CHRAS|nr:PREDICTED: probable phospholipid-transporting ATPase IK [Chrysochloris asiatica]
MPSLGKGPSCPSIPQPTWALPASNTVFQSLSSSRGCLESPQLLPFLSPYSLGRDRINICMDFRVPVCTGGLMPVGVIDCKPQGKMERRRGLPPERRHPCPPTTETPPGTPAPAKTRLRARPRPRIWPRPRARAARFGRLRRANSPSTSAAVDIRGRVRPAQVRGGQPSVVRPSVDWDGSGGGGDVPGGPRASGFARRLWGGVLCTKDLEFPLVEGGTEPEAGVAFGGQPGPGKLQVDVGGIILEKVLAKQQPAATSELSPSLSPTIAPAWAASTIKMFSKKMKTQVRVPGQSKWGWGCSVGTRDDKFTWEVKANNQCYHWKCKEKVFVCCQRKRYKTNVIHTAKYSFFTFLPMNLYEQFHRVSNLYFLLIIILQSIPEISTLPWFTLFMPLVCLLVIRAARDLVDDIGRHRSDTTINNRPCQILVGKSFLWRKWKDLCVGDVICLHKNSLVPADMLLLASTEPSSLCYVETADIDGETNLKFRQALAVTHHELNNVRKMSTFQGKVVCEKPNSRMHNFVGYLEWNDKRYPLDCGNILLRGCKIRNTDTCYGLVIYAGFDTKIMKSCGKIHLKRTKLDHLMNRLVVIIFLFLVLVSLVLTLGFHYKTKEFKDKHYYIPTSLKHTDTMESIFTFWGFLILLSVMIPMAMFISAEFIYLGNSIFINWDMKMYYAPLDIPAKARSTSLNDQLGQVEHIFSDKTGTLTQNVMTFKSCCINGYIYGEAPGTPGPRDLGPQDQDPSEKVSPVLLRWMVGVGGGRDPTEARTLSWLVLLLAAQNPYQWNEFADGKLLFYNKELLAAVRTNQDQVVREFWRLLALCHTVMVQEQDSEAPDQLLYQAASPDEEALVTAARNFGYVFLSRTQDTITLMELGQEYVYEVLAMMDFNSVRKRMSVLVRNPEGLIYLYTKGADMVIFQRLNKRDMTESTTEEALAAFAEQTLRTLCLAYKQVDKDVYEAWRQRHEEASLLLQNRAQALHQLLGATAIEDRLQDGVPDTIKCLKNGNIKVWMLTGDKQETAVNIGFACQLLSEDMIILEEKEIVHILKSYSDSNNNLLDGKGRFRPQVKIAMVITGDFLDQLMIPTLFDKHKSLPRSMLAEEAWGEPSLHQEAWLTRVPRMWHSFLMPLGISCVARQAQGRKLSESPEVRRERAFVDLAVRCQAVICCRVTPKQKALIVTLVKRHKGVVTLAIGDGANDVNMIKTADIGVGLAGQEGMQAVQNSDYVLAQFSFLRRLLLVHGRWSYVRICKFLRYFIYKTLASMMAQIWFAFYNGFTAQPLYEGWFLALFNLLYSTLPVLYIGLFEQDVSAEKSLQMPELYTAGQKEELFNYWVFIQALAHGMITSLVNFFITLMACHNTGDPSTLSDYQSFGVIVALSSLLSITMEVILIIKYWTILSVLAIVLSLCCYIFMTYATQSFWAFNISPKTFPFLYTDRNVLSHPFALVVILLNVCLNTMFALAFRIIYQIVKKSRVKVEEVPSEEIVEEPISYIHRGSRVRRSSYAFSHREGYANLITQGTIMRRARDTNSELMNDEQPPSEDEMPPSMKDSSWHPRRLSLLGKKKHQRVEKTPSEDVVFNPMGNSSVASEGQAPHLENQSKSSIPMTSPEKKPSSRDRSLSSGKRSLSKEGSLSPKESLPSTSVSHPQPSEGQSLPPESQSLTRENSSSFWRFLRLPWLLMWQRDLLFGEKTEAVPSETPQSLGDRPPPPAEESLRAEQPVEAEPWSQEKQSSSMEWLPVTIEDHVQPGQEAQSPSPPEKQ